MIEFIDKNIWTGRFDDEDGETGLRWHQKVETRTFRDLPYTAYKEIALLGFCSDEGVRRNKGRVGAAAAPDLIRKALANLPYNPHKQKKIWDFGNIILSDANLEAARKEQSECVATLVEKNYFPIILGGGHETALGDFLGLTQKFKNIGIINIDAHFDIRIPVEKSSSGTPFFEMYQYCTTHERDFNYFAIGIQPNGNTQALFDRAKEMGAEWVTADEIHDDFEKSLDKLDAFIQKFDAIYLSLDLDVLDAAFAPGVSAPCVNGLFPFQVKKIIEKVRDSGNTQLFDVVELNPNYDIDSHTAKLAALFVSEFSYISK